MAIFGKQSYRVRMSPEGIAVKPYGDTKPDEKYLKRAMRDAELIAGSVEEIRKEYGVTDSAMNKDFILEYRRTTLVPKYKGINEDGLDRMELGVYTAGKKGAAHEGSHMAHRWALEDLIEKDPEFVERFEKNLESLKVKDKRVPLLKVLDRVWHRINKSRNDTYKSNNKSEDILEKMWKENSQFCEKFANKHAGMANGEPIMCGIHTALGAVAFGNSAIWAENLMEISKYMTMPEIIEQAPSYIIAPIMLFAAGAFLASNTAGPVINIIKNRNENGLVPSYLNKEAA
jgi:hypothetical protein